MSKAFRFTSRTKARKRAADVVFEADQRGMGRNPDALRDLLRQRKVITAAETPLPEYSIQAIEGVADNLRRIDDLIEKHANVAGLDRIAGVDLAVMRVGVWEMLENDDVPNIIAIDEAIAIVKSISGDGAPQFVNAVLDAIRRDLEASPWLRRSRDNDVDVSTPGDDTPGVASSGVASSPKVPDLSVDELEELDELLDEY